LSSKKSRGKVVRSVNPRIPTKKEIQEYVGYLKTNGYGNLKKEVARWPMAVFANCKTVHPSYQGKMLLVATATTPNVGLDIAEMYIYPDGKITRVTEMANPRDWLPKEGVSIPVPKQAGKREQ
jgi:hypothetical protein